MTLRAQPPSSALPPSPHPSESRSPSFLLKGLTWRSFTHRRTSEPQLAPASALHPIPALLPAPSAQITPRVQPSVVPTPRMAAAAPAAPAALTSSNSGPLQPRIAPSAQGFAAALHAAAAEEEAAKANPDTAAGSAGSEQAPVANGHAPSAARHWQPNGQQPQTYEQQQQEQLNGQHHSAQEQQQQEQQETCSLISWRSDAVQLPEQVLLHAILPASPTASAGAAAACASQDSGASLTARTRGR